MLSLAKFSPSLFTSKLLSIQITRVFQYLQFEKLEELGVWPGICCSCLSLIARDTRSYSIARVTRSYLILFAWITISYQIARVIRSYLIARVTKSYTITRVTRSYLIV